MIIVNANLIPQVGRNNKTIKSIFYLTLALSDDVGGEKRLTSGLREKLFPDENSREGKEVGVSSTTVVVAHFKLIKLFLGYVAAKKGKNNKRRRKIFAKPRNFLMFS